MINQTLSGYLLVVFIFSVAVFHIVHGLKNIKKKNESTFWGWIRVSIGILLILIPIPIYLLLTRDS